MGGTGKNVKLRIGCGVIAVVPVTFDQTRRSWIKEGHASGETLLGAYFTTFFARAISSLGFPL